MASLLDTLSRRRFLVGSGTIAALVAHNRMRGAMAQRPVEHGDCELIPAMYWYREFQKAHFTNLPYTELNEHLPQRGWTVTSDPDFGPFMVPPGWTTDNFFANQFERDGSPIWTSEYIDHPRWTATMVTEPDQNAFFMMISAVVDGIQVDSAGGAKLSKDLAIGAEVEVESFCLGEQYSVENTIPKSVWISGSTFDEYVIMSNGHSLFADFAGMQGGPGSRVFANILVCPFEEADTYMREVYLRIMWQFVPRASGGDKVTPTPSPTP